MGVLGHQPFGKAFSSHFGKTEQESQEIMRVIENKAVDLFLQDTEFLRTEAFFLVL